MQAMIIAISNNTEVTNGINASKEYQNFLANYKKAQAAQLAKIGESSSGITIIERSRNYLPAFFIG